MERLPAWLKNKWVLYGLSFAAALLLLLILFFAFLRGPLAGLLTKQGARAYESGDYSKSAGKYAMALSLKKNREEIYIGYGDALIKLEEYTRAHEVLSSGIERLSGSEGIYLCRVRAFVAEGRIGDAVDFLDQIQDSYINKKIQAARPGDLSFTPAQGRYSTAQKITLTPREGETIDYTLNGEDPQITSQVYSAPVTVSKTATFTAIAVSSEGLVSPRLRITYEIDNANEAISFADAKVERMVRDALEKPSGRITAAQLAGITALSSEGIEGSIRTLSDLEYLTGLSALSLSGELLIGDFSPLAGLASLSSLRITGCAFSDGDLAHLSACTQLSELELDYNQITSLSAVKTLKYLEYLNVAHNDIVSTSSLSAFPLLASLNLSGNRLCELSGIGELDGLVSLDVSDNYISDFSPLASLSKLTELSIRGNTPSNIKKLSALQSLASLDISDCKLSSLSVVNDFKALQVLFATDNEISSLATFTRQVTELYISRNPLVDLTPLRDQKNLAVLEAAETAISSVSFLNGAAALTMLDITGTSVTDATPLAGCQNLQTLFCPAACNTAGLPAQVEIINY